ncbi:MAG: hypothetical protein R3B46_10905 [Phycisphaerales bacterium]
MTAAAAWSMSRARRLFSSKADGWSQGINDTLRWEAWGVFSWRTESNLVQSRHMQEKSLPNQVKWHRTVQALNQTLAMWSGDCKLEFENGDKCTAKANIEFRCTPNPHAWVKFETDEIAVSFEHLGNAKLVANVLEVEQCTICQFQKRLGEASIFEGIFRGVSKWNNQPAPYEMRFQLLNFIKYIGDPVKYVSGGGYAGRLVLPDPEYQIVLDTIEDGDREWFIQLNNSRGYATTHCGLLRRRDSSSLDIESLNGIIPVLKYFASFVRGAWAEPCLLRLYGNEEDMLMEQMVSARVDPSTTGLSWVSQLHAHDIARFYSCFRIKGDRVRSARQLSEQSHGISSLSRLWPHWSLQLFFRRLCTNFWASGYLGGVGRYTL